MTYPSEAETHVAIDRALALWRPFAEALYDHLEAAERAGLIDAASADRRWEAFVALHRSTLEVFRLLGATINLVVENGEGSRLPMPPPSVN
jgi:hypothetical protein